LAEKESEGSPDPELAHLQKKTEEGAVNVVTAVLDDPKIQKIIREGVLRETFKSGMVMAFLFVGIMLVFSALKSFIGFNWVGDLIVGSVLMVIGLIYMVKNIFIKQKVEEPAN